MIAASDDLVGTVIDNRFEVTGRIGAGGMGTVYRARQRSVDRDVALKVLDRRFEADVTAVKRFFREAKVASTLSHPNTVAIIDFGQNADGRLYIAMELVRGRTLHDEIDEHGALPLARVIAIGAQLSDALEVAHATPIVHRDLKLENVMLVEGGRDQVKVLDFGLALSLAEPDNRATAVGIVSGTPRYMPLEVFEGAAPAPAQDMYSLGVMLGELSTGLSLWSDGLNLAGLFAEKRDTLTSVEDVPLELRTLVRSLIDVDPSRRPTAADVRKALREITPGVLPPIAKPSILPRKELPASAKTESLAATVDQLVFPNDLALVDVDGGSTSRRVPVIPSAETAVSSEPKVEFRTPRPRPSHELELELSAADRELELEVEPPRRRDANPSTAPRSGRVSAPPSSSPSPPRATTRRRWLGPVVAVVVLAVAAGGFAIYQHSHSSAPQLPTSTKPTPHHATPSPPKS
jgi:serine/threonine-protein kinase